MKTKLHLGLTSLALALAAVVGSGCYAHGPYDYPGYYGQPGSYGYPAYGYRTYYPPPHRPYYAAPPPYGYAAPPPYRYAAPPVHRYHHVAPPMAHPHPHPGHHGHHGHWRH